jgi:hypothetical protein
MYVPKDDVETAGLARAVMGGKSGESAVRSAKEQAALKRKTMAQRIELEVHAARVWVVGGAPGCSGRGMQDSAPRPMVSTARRREVTFEPRGRGGRGGGGGRGRPPRGRGKGAGHW